MVLRVVEDLANGFAVVDDLVANVRTGLAFLDPLDSVVFESGTKLLVQVNLGTLTKLVARLLVELTLELVKLLLQFLVLLELFCLCAVHSIGFRFVQRLALLGERFGDRLAPLRFKVLLNVRADARFLGFGSFRLPFVEPSFEVFGGKMIWECLVAERASRGSWLRKQAVSAGMSLGLRRHSRFLLGLRCVLFSPIVTLPATI